MGISSEVEEMSEREESIEVESENSLNARMFEDNFNSFEYGESDRNNFIPNEYENIFEGPAMEEAEIFEYRE